MKYKYIENNNEYIVDVSHVRFLPEELRKAATIEGGTLVYNSVNETCYWMFENNGKTIYKHHGILKRM